MNTSRQNRFARTGQGNHSFDSCRADDMVLADIELGQSPTSCPPSWTYADSEATTTDAEIERLVPMSQLRSKPFSSAKPDFTSAKRDAKTNGARQAPWRKSPRVSSRAFSRLCSLIKTALMSLGALQCLMYLCLFIEAVFPDEVDLISGPLKDHFASPDLPGLHSEYSLDHLTAGVRPFMCHSHNDYWRREPLFQAIKAGCTGVEADMWLFNDELYVAHTPSGVRRNRTIESLYLDPLMRILDHKNTIPDFLGPDANQHYRRTGVYDTMPEQSLVLLLDFKRGQNSTQIWDRLSTLLHPFRQKNYLTYFNGASLLHAPLTIVVSGHPPFDRIVANATHRDIFFDAPLQCLTEPDGQDAHHQDCASVFDSTGSLLASDMNYSPANSYYASTSFIRSIGYPLHSSLTQSQLNKLRIQIRTAHAQGLKVRYWGIPAWPIGVRNYLWRVLVREGVDYLSVDDIEDVRWKDWGPRKGGWGKKWWR